MAWFFNCNLACPNATIRPFMTSFKRNLMFKFLLPVLLLALSLSACNNQPNSKAPYQLPPDTVHATINGEKITEKEVKEKGGKWLEQIEESLFDAKRDVLENIVHQKMLNLEAKKRNITVSELLKKEIYEKVVPPTPEEIEAFYEQHKEQFGKEEKEKILPFLAQQLRSQRGQVLQEDLIASLEEKYDIKILFTKPIERLPDVSVDDDPSLGPKDAPVTIVEFTDYQCPFCTKVRPTIKKILTLYPDKVKYVVRDFPLDFHPNAPKASEAANCANEQGKFWEFNDLLWANQSNLVVPNLKILAKNLGLDSGKFDQCLDSGQYAQEVQKDFKDGSKLGVNGTPAFFINGRPVSGARNLSYFKRIIDEEIKLSKKKSS